MSVQVTIGLATDLGQGGAWDEVYQTAYTSIGDAKTAWTGASTVFSPSGRSPLGRRMAALSDQCYAYYVRFSYVFNADRLRADLTKGRLDGYRSSENYAGDAASFRVFNTSGGAHRQIRLGGLPDNVVDGNVIQTSFVNSYILGASGFLQAYVNANGAILYRNTLIGGPSSRPILSVTKTNQDSTCSVAIATAIDGLAVGSTVVISVRGQPQFRGNWVVSSLSTDKTQIVLRGSERVSAPINPGGYITLAGYSVQSINGGTAANPLDPSIVSLSAHKLGKKKYQPRGRRSPILIRH